MNKKGGNEETLIQAAAYLGRKRPKSRGDRMKANRISKEAC